MHWTIVSSNMSKRTYLEKEESKKYVPLGRLPPADVVLLPSVEYHPPSSLRLVAT